MQFKNVKDVRDLNSQLLKLNRFSEYDDPNELLRAEFYEYYWQIRFHYFNKAMKALIVFAIATLVTATTV